MPPPDTADDPKMDRGAPGPYLAGMTAHPLVLDDLSCPAPRTPLGTTWELVSDRVMGGVSDGTLTRTTLAGRMALRLSGSVSLENNGGFLQMALDLRPDGSALDARAFTGVELDVFGNDQSYNLHLRTADVIRPWQSYRLAFTAPAQWSTLRLPFSDVTPHRVDAPFDPATLRRIGIVAIGRAFRADIAIARIALYP
ncbi:hypothetical protein RAZWK3B_17888 [Roseobacter sp. AzwK-3b]|nr:hypothetical protein RAZWK3B_17888 [Roseobacter sp. AzwK-3b]